jgi:hypothetical protein
MTERLFRAIDNYELSLRQGAAGRLRESAIRERVERYSIAAARQDLLLDQVRQVLCSAGVATIMFPMYHAFSRHLDKLSRQDISHETLQRAVMASVTTWEMRGLKRPVLLAIASDVYNIPAPEPSTGSRD